MRELFFWNSAADEQIRRAAAKALADQIDDTFIRLRRAAYHQGVDSSAARFMLKTCLSDGDLTLTVLADKVDEYYKFRREGYAENE